MLRIMLMICFVPLVPILYAMLRSEAKFKKNIALGVTLPYEARQDPVVTNLCAGYKRWLTAICAGLLVFQIPFYFIPSGGVFMLVYLIWILFVITLPYLPFFYYHRRLKAYKEARGWGSGQRDSVVVDLKAAAQEKHSLSSWLFLPPVIISIIPIIAETARNGMESWAFVLVYVLLSAMVASFYLFYQMINRQRADIVDENTALNQTLTRIRRYNWSKMWLWMAWLTGAFNFFLWFFMGRWISLMVMIAVYMVLCLLTVIRTEFTAQKAQYKLTAESGQGSYIDDDQYWPHGIFYYNPKDKHLMINKRTGIGTTVNMGRPAGKAIMALSALVIAMLPLAGVWMAVEDAAPLTLAIIGEEVVATHTGAYHVALDAIQEVDLLEELPEDAIRLVGIGTENLSKGKYRVPGIGQCQLNLDPNTGPFLVLYTEDTTYLFGTRNPEDTRAVYRALQATNESEI